MHIFVAEDEKTIRRELTILLENAMYQVTAPEDFENIPDQITEASPDPAGCEPSGNVRV